jgi:hypothetical protein
MTAPTRKRDTVIGRLAREVLCEGTWRLETSGELDDRPGDKIISLVWTVTPHDGSPHEFRHQFMRSDANERCFDVALALDLKAMRNKALNAGLTLVAKPHDAALAE